MKYPMWVLSLVAACCAVCPYARAEDSPIVPGLTYVCNGERLHINTTPKALDLTFHPDGTIVGPAGPVTIDGLVATGYHSGHSPNAVYKDTAGNEYDGNRNELPTTAGYDTFSPKRTTCPAINLTSKGASAGIQTMQTDLLKTAFGGDKGPPMPPGFGCRESMLLRRASVCSSFLNL